MDNEKLLSKIAKLKAMAACSGPEADNAKRIIQTLIDRYNLDPNQVLDIKKKIIFKVHRLKKYSMMLANWMGEVVYTIRGKPDYIALNLTSDEYKMFYELLDEIKHIFNKKERELNAEPAKYLEPGESEIYDLPKWALDKAKQEKNDKLRSFMIGYMQSNYPIPETDRGLCLICKKGKIVDQVCNSCGHKYGNSKWHKYGLDANEFNKGLSTNRKSLRQTKMALEYK